MSKFDDSLSDWIRKAIDAGLIETHTALPAIVDTFNATTQRARVNVAINRISLIDGSEVLTPPVFDVPVFFPSGGGYSLTVPVAQGDEVLLVFCERDIGPWKRSGSRRKPVERHRHQYIDAIAFAGIRSNPKALSSYSTNSAQLRKDDGSAFVEVSNSEIKLDIGGTGGATFHTNGSVTFANGASITAAGDFVSATSITLDTHVHGGVTTGGGTTGAAQ
jgi:hypothetical protein